MLKGLCITPPIMGRISIGKVVERQGKRLPEKDDQFTLTSQIQGRDGWLPHPFDEALRKAQGGKIRSIPIRLLFNDPDLNFRAHYTLFDRKTGRQLCVGNGEQCRRRSQDGISVLTCPSPDQCTFGEGSCKPYGRLNVVIGDDDPLCSFVFRTTGFNSIRTLIARLQYLQAVSGNKLSCMPLELRLRGKSTRQSMGTPIFYADITVRASMTLEETLLEAARTAREREAAGFDQAALEQAARQGFANGEFEDSEEERGEVIEEFYPLSTEDVATKAAMQGATSTAQLSLAEKLGNRLPLATPESVMSGAAEKPEGTPRSL
ncbi:hydrolase or metal-binding protein [Uliginosibacterium sp. sgz301328]|uniref:recombination directionality factor n=1 Tax=Uliginosibacterium sp. sgz301328 TaxID=3243764 RepID=UPI00359CF4F3